MLTCHPFKFQAQCHLLWPRTIIEDTLQNNKQSLWSAYIYRHHFHSFHHNGCVKWYYVWIYYILYCNVFISFFKTKYFNLVWHYVCKINVYVVTQREIDGFYIEWYRIREESELSINRSVWQIIWSQAPSSFDIIWRIETPLE